MCAMDKTPSDNFTIVDMQSYARKDHYAHYLKMQCGFNITVNIDITFFLAKIKSAKLRFLPCLTWLLSTAVNAMPEFRMGKNDDDKLIEWEIVHPCYVVLKDETKTFSGIWTRYLQSFKAFYAACVSDIDTYVDGSLEPKGPPPQNNFFVSCVPTLQFSALSFNVPDLWFAPILTCGKFFKDGEKTLLPVALQIHHAICDGYHAGKFFELLQSLADKFDTEN